MDLTKICTHMQTYSIVVYTVTHTLIYIETETDKRGGL